MAYTPTDWDSGDTFGAVHDVIHENFSNIKASLSDISTSIGGNIVCGVYKGDGQETRTINLGFRPAAVLVMQEGNYPFMYSGIRGGFATTMRDVTETYRGEEYPALQIAANGFTVFYNTIGSGIDTNYENWLYYYIAFRNATVKNFV